MHLTEDLGPSKKMVEQFTARRKKVLELIKEIPGLKMF